jgi:phosphatidate cytidylyltransferase
MPWAVLILVLLVLLAFYVIRYPKDTIDEVAKCVFAFLYVTVLMSYIYQTRCLAEGKWLVWLILIGSWGSDTCAYVIGKLIGKHHFSELSPKKTVEGCVGGIAGAALLGFCYAFYFPDQSYLSVSPKVVFPVIMAVCALVSQIGDLAASAIKRNYDIKDYGNVIPGHGGILDRFDSVLFVAPFVYYLLNIFSMAGYTG